MLESPCRAVRHGDGSVSELAKAYVENTGCIVKHQLLLKELRGYNETINNKNNKESGGGSGDS